MPTYKEIIDKFDGNALLGAEAMHAEHWSEFLHDIINEATDAYHALMPQKGQELDVAFASLIDQLSPIARRLISTAIRSIDAQGLSDSSTIRLVFIAMKLSCQDSVSYLRSIVCNLSKHVDVRISAAKCLSGMCNLQNLDFWDDFDLVSLPELRSSVVYAISALDPRRAIDIAATFETPKDTREFFIPIQSTVRYLVRKEEVAYLRRTFGKAQRWLQLLIQEVCKGQEFCNLDLLSDRNPQEVRVISQSQLALYESSLKSLSDVIVICSTVEKPDKALFEVVTSNMSRGIRYTFFISSENYPKRAMLVKPFEAIANFITTDPGNATNHIEELLRIVPLNGNWLSTPYVFYRSSEEETVIGFAGVETGRGVCDDYFVMEKSFAATVYNRIIENSTNAEEQFAEIISFDQGKFADAENILQFPVDNTRPNAAS